MGRITREEIIVYSHDSTYSGYRDSHTFAVVPNKKIYKNCGGEYKENIKEVCKGTVYQTWLDAFMPNQTTEFKDAGIRFASNGVCHTYAMREILLCDEEGLDTSSAPGDDMCVSYYGKYGTGLSYLKTRLIESFKEAQKKEDLPDQLLDKILNRISIDVKYETEAWISAMKNCFGIDVESYYRDEYDRSYLERRVEYLIQEREELFDKCFDASNRTLSDDFRKRKKELYENEFRTYIYDLERYGYFQIEDAEAFVEKFNKALKLYDAECRRILAEFGQ